MSNDATQDKAPKKRGRPRKTVGDGVGDKVLASLQQDAGSAHRLDCPTNDRTCKLPNIDKRLLENGTKGFSKMSDAACFMRRHYIRLCTACVLITLMVLSFGVPYVWWLLDRTPPYVFKDVDVQSGYPGQLVAITATIEEATPGRVCGVIVNPQVISEAGHLAFANQTRLIAGEAIQAMERTPAGKILFRTELQVPQTLTEGKAKLIVPLEMMCQDNQTHAGNPIHASILAPWFIEKKPAGAPSLTCPRKGKQ